MVYLEIGVLTSSFAIGAIMTYFGMNLVMPSPPSDDDTDTTTPKPYPFAFYVCIDILTWLLLTVVVFGIVFLLWNSVNARGGGYVSSFIAFLDAAFQHKPWTFLYALVLAVIGLTIVGLIIGERPGIVPKTLNTSFKFGNWSMQQIPTEDDPPQTPESRAMQVFNLIVFLVGTCLPIIVALSSG